MATSKLHSLFVTEHQATVSLVDFKDVQARCGLNKVDKHNGRHIPATGPLTLADLILWPDVAHAEIAIVCRRCQRLGGRLEALVLCGACLRSTGQAPYWCNAECFRRDQDRHAITCSSFVGQLPALGPRLSSGARLQLGQTFEACSAAAALPPVTPGETVISLISDYYISPSILNSVGRGDKSDLPFHLKCNLAEFRASYACCLDTDAFTLDERSRSARFLYECLINGVFPDDVDLTKNLGKQWHQLMAQQLGDELGLDPLAVPQGEGLPPDDALDPIAMLQHHGGQIDLNCGLVSGMRIELQPSERTPATISEVVHRTAPCAAFHLTRALETGALRYKPSEGYALPSPGSKPGVYGPWTSLRLTRCRSEELSVAIRLYKSDHHFLDALQEVIDRVLANEADQARDRT